MPSFALRVGPVLADVSVRPPAPGRADVHTAFSSSLSNIDFPYFSIM
jgi:hypothetical protein